jgi:4a-hydroxytetrahydrobiopterin dehydratase
MRSDNAGSIDRTDDVELEWDTPLQVFTVAINGGLIKADCLDISVTSVIWIENDKGLHCDLEFADFVGAWTFMNQVAVLAETMDHHPDWSNSYNKVHITLISHDKGCVTSRDRRMAEAIDQLVASGTV